MLPDINIGFTSFRETFFLRTFLLKNHMKKMKNAEDGKKKRMKAALFPYRFHIYFF